MQTASRAPAVTAYADEVLGAVDIFNNPYLQALRDGSMSLDCFRRTQEQFFFAVTFFPRPMAALVGRISDPRARLDILHNLVEEHGEFQEQRFHHTTFQTFLRSIGARVDGLEEMPVWPAVRAFNSVLTCACVLDELEVGVGCMGIIEHAFSGISAIIGKAVVERGWVAQDQLVHYALHAEIDTRHAEEFFAVVETPWGDPARRYFIRQGLELGAYIFDRLYRDLFAAGRAELTAGSAQGTQQTGKTSVTAATERPSKRKRTASRG
ncbi:MAG TPA: iron-containing redox enzyme family protein [Gemmataceae bacterium]|nr:iron-containing redox enzyme family protein [Gemmataceae bacterium]